MAPESSERAGGAGGAVAGQHGEAAHVAGLVAPGVRPYAWAGGIGAVEWEADAAAVVGFRAADLVAVEVGADPDSFAGSGGLEGTDEQVAGSIAVEVDGLVAVGVGHDEPAGVEVPVVQACGAGESAGEDCVGEDALAVGEAAEVPVSVCLLVVGDAPVAAADVDALGGVLVFGLVVHVDALAGFEVCVAAGRVHDLVDAVDEVGDVWFGAGGGVVPCAGVGDELVELSAPCVVLVGDACGDVAEGDGGGGLVAGEVLFDLQDASFEAQGRGEAGVDDVDGVADVGAFGVDAGGGEAGDVAFV